MHECHLSFLDVFLTHGTKGLGASTGHFLAMRILTKKPAQFYIDHCQDFDIADEQSLPVVREGFDGLEMAFNFVTHLDTTAKQFQKLLVAVFNFQCLCLNTYFQNINTEGKSFNDFRICFNFRSIVTKSSIFAFSSGLLQRC